MHLSTKNKIISALIFLITLIPVFILPLFGIDKQTYILFSGILIVLTFAVSKFNKSLFSTILFFTLIHVSKPVNDWFITRLNLSFPGTYYLIPTLVFTILILTVPQIKQSINWWARDTIDRKSILLIAALSLVSGLSLVIWSNYFAEDLNAFRDMLPDVSIFWLIVNGIGFSIFNAIAEEYLSRGMLINGLEKLISIKWPIILIQAIVFSIFHYYGFPGGITGVIMVFAWSIILGIIRYRTKGLMGVLIGHFWADLTIYFILYLL